MQQIQQTLLTIDQIDSLAWDKCNQLIPAIVQDQKTGLILMHAYVNKESLLKTFTTQKVCFYSRSRQSLWTKGETSGNWLHLAQCYTDCDRDTILILANPTDSTCHLNRQSCFDYSPSEFNFLMQLENIIQDRIKNTNNKSYTNQLYQKGIKKIAQKVGEEGVEVALAGADINDDTLLDESADLIFHLLVLLKSRNHSISEVLNVLQKRNKHKNT